MSDELVPVEVIENKIYIIRGYKVMLDMDLAALYGIDTSQLNRQVKRNNRRFPQDFMFQLNKEEWEILRCQFGISSSRPQFVTLKPGGRRYFPYAFTEHGILMLSSVLSSDRAVAVNIQIMRTFTKLRRMFVGYRELKEKIEQIEAKYDGQFREVFDAINKLMEPPAEEERRIDVGFKP